MFPLVKKTMALVLLAACATVSRTAWSETAMVESSSAAVPAVEVEAPLPTWAFGVGYPDLRVRKDLGRLDVELKAALAADAQAYSARVYAQLIKLGPLDVKAGAELGFARFQMEDLNGEGVLAEPFLGVDYRFARRWRLNVDLGPLWARISANGRTRDELPWVFNTALYFYFL